MSKSFESLPVWPLRKIDGKRFTREEIESLTKRINEEYVPGVPDNRHLDIRVGSE